VVSKIKKGKVMKRYNLFYQIHKALRCLLYHTGTQLQHTDFCNEEQAAAATERVAFVVRFFDKHAHTEDHYILPIIQTHEPSVATLFEAEHEQDHALGNTLRELLNRLAYVETAESKEETGAAICVAFNEFIAFNLTHMAKEEKALNQLLWKYLNDEQLHAITMEIIKQLPHNFLMESNTWMMRALSNNEISNWLLQIKNTAPDEVFHGMLQLAEAELPAARFEAMTASLTEGALLA
jgi:hypothetical protein